MSEQEKLCKKFGKIVTKDANGKRVVWQWDEKQQKAVKK